MKVTGFKDTIDWYDNNAKKYADATFVNPPLDLIDQYISLLPNNPKVLDAGCGAGRDSALLAERRALVTGLDISKGLLKEAKKRFSEISFIEGSFLDIPFKEDTFDGVWAHAALVHLEEIEDVKKSITEFQRVLKNSGILHLYVKKQLGSNRTEVITDKLSNHDRFFRYYSEEEIREYLNNENFKIVDFTIRNDAHGRDEVKWISLFAKKA